MAVHYIAGDVKGHDKATHSNPDNGETPEVYLINVFGIQEEVGDTQQFTETTGYHNEQQIPTEQQYLILFDIVYQKLDRETIKNSFQHRVHCNLSDNGQDQSTVSHFF